MLKLGMVVDLAGEPAAVIAESADGRRVWLESATHPYPGVAVEADAPRPVRVCPWCGHRATEQPAPDPLAGPTTPDPGA